MVRTRMTHVFTLPMRLSHANHNSYEYRPYPAPANQRILHTSPAPHAADPNTRYHDILYIAHEAAPVSVVSIKQGKAG